MGAFKKAVKKFKPSKDAHSAFVYKEGGEVKSEKGYYCYAPLLPHDENEITKIAIFFGEGRIKDAKDPEGWLQWLMNDSGVSDAFTTKDASEGLSEGIHMNLKADVGVVAGALLTMRCAFEYPHWAWGYLVEMGVDPLDAYFLSHRINIQKYEDNLVIEGWGGVATEHRLFTNSDAFDTTSMKKLKLVGESYLDHSDYIGSVRNGVFGSNDVHHNLIESLNGLNLKSTEIDIENLFGGSAKVNKFLLNEENVDNMLKMAKGE